MPSPILHLDILFHLREITPDLLNAELLLGIISPDAIHMRINQTWEDKAKTHFYFEADQSYELAISTAQQTLVHTSSSFLQGYIIHLYTDYLWRERIYTPFFNVRKDTLIRSKLHELYYQEMKIIDQYFLQKGSWLEEAKALLDEELSIDAYPILNCQEIKSWKEKVKSEDLSQCVNTDEQVLTAFSLNEIDQFIQDCVHKLIEKSFI